MVKYNEHSFKRANLNGNHIISSSLKQFDNKVNTLNYSLKIPVNGTEYYSVDGIKHKVKPGFFVLTKPGQEVHAVVDSNTNVDSRCIYIDNSLIEDGAKSILQNDIFADKTIKSRPNFISGKYNIGNHHLGGVLNNIFSKYNNDFSFNEEFYHQLALNLMLHQFGVEKALSSINAHSFATKTELYFRLETAKTYILDNYREDIRLCDVSSNSNISKFHLIRVFKDVYGLTPYGFLLARRLEKACELLKRNPDLSIEDIALICGFNQRRTFTKSFMKKYRITPKLFQKSHIN